MAQTLALECLRSREARDDDPSRTNPSAKLRSANGQNPGRKRLLRHALLAPPGLADRPDQSGRHPPQSGSAWVTEFGMCARQEFLPRLLMPEKKGRTHRKQRDVCATRETALLTAFSRGFIG